MRLFIQALVFVLVAYGLTQWENSALAGQSFSIGAILLLVAVDVFAGILAARVVGRLTVRIL